jgi:hypothetical protein
MLMQVCAAVVAHQGSGSVHSPLPLAGLPPQAACLPWRYGNNAAAAAAIAPLLLPSPAGRVLGFSGGLRWRAGA